MHLDPHQRRLLTETESLSADMVGRLADQAIDRYEQLTRDGHPACKALWPPVEDPAAADRAAGEATAEFERAAGSQDWSVPQDRIRQLAADAIGLYVEGYAYDYDREQARAAAVLECVEGEAARRGLPAPPEVQVPAPTARASASARGASADA
jgi:hypothetical protein